MIFSFFIILLALWTGFSESSLSSKNFAYSKEASIYSWDPKNDAIYDPVSGFCHFQKYASIRFLPSSLKLMEGIRDANSSIETTTTMADEIAPELLFSPISLATTRSASSSQLYIPEKCKNFERKWDFYIGHPEEDTKIIGWISRVGFACNLINELNLPTFNNSYTLLPYGLRSKANIWKDLHGSRYIEFTCHNTRLFPNLFSISSKVDSTLRRSIIAIKITFYVAESVCVKIFVDTGKDLGGRESVFRQLYTLFPFISYYIDY